MTAGDGLNLLTTYAFVVAFGRTLRVQQHQPAGREFESNRRSASLFPLLYRARMKQNAPSRNNGAHQNGAAARHTYNTNEQRWLAVQRREPAADGQFVYSVATTGVYCRPTCPSRLALRENVAFHYTCADAARAGFRPCQRCRPAGASQRGRHAEAAAKALRITQTSGSF